MMKLWRLPLLILCLCYAASGCGKKEASYVDNLPANPTTGYNWQVSELEPSGEYDGQVTAEIVYAPGEDPGQVAGAPGVSRVTITGAAPGKARLQLVYVQAWEYDGDPASAGGRAYYEFQVETDLSLELLGASYSLPGELEDAPKEPTP